jgi:hypothetical protein
MPSLSELPGATDTHKRGGGPQSHTRHAHPMLRRGMGGRSAHKTHTHLTGFRDLQLPHPPTPSKHEALNGTALRHQLTLAH